MRKAITAEERLIVTLRYLATGRSLEDLKFSAIISPQALGNIIPETCDCIYKALKKKYLKFPNTVEEWEKIARDYNSRWNFPNCGGSIDDTGDIVKGDWRNGVMLDGLRPNLNRNSSLEAKEN
ncbi:hypothetical protein JTB14_037285 [Gonioctena quinquepunctata]|nr:hypothetical protein JTB14_037285 [Gonioctena quinquepunctata]